MTRTEGTFKETLIGLTPLVIVFCSMAGLYVYIKSIELENKRLFEKEKILWQDRVQSGECKVVDFGFNRNGKAVTAVYECNGYKSVGPVIN